MNKTLKNAKMKRHGFRNKYFKNRSESYKMTYSINIFLGTDLRDTDSHSNADSTKDNFDLSNQKCLLCKI